MSCTNINFEIIAITSTGITKTSVTVNKLNFNDYSYEFTSTVTSAGGTLLYIDNHLCML